MKKFLTSFFIYVFFGILISAVLFFLESKNTDFSTYHKPSDATFITSVLLLAAATFKLLTSAGFFSPFGFLKEKIFKHSQISYPEYCSTPAEHKPCLHIFAAAAVFLTVALITLSFI